MPLNPPPHTCNDVCTHIHTHTLHTSALVSCISVFPLQSMGLTFILISYLLILQITIHALTETIEIYHPMVLEVRIPMG